MTIAAYRRTLSEEAMRDAIVEAVAWLGGRVFWVNRSDSSPAMADFPDLVILLPRRQTVVFCELKSQDRRVTVGQQAVIDLLAECPRTDAMVVRPDPHDGEASYDQFIAWLAGNDEALNALLEGRE